VRAIRRCFVGTMHVCLTNRSKRRISSDEGRPLIELKPPFIPVQLVQYVYDDQLRDWAAADADNTGAVRIMYSQSGPEKNCTKFNAPSFCNYLQ